MEREEFIEVVEDILDNLEAYWGELPKARPRRFYITKDIYVENGILYRDNVKVRCAAHVLFEQGHHKRTLARLRAALAWHEKVARSKKITHKYDAIIVFYLLNAKSLSAALMSAEDSYRVAAKKAAKLNVRARKTIVTHLARTKGNFSYSFCDEENDIFSTYSESYKEKHYAFALKQLESLTERLHIKTAKAIGLEREKYIRKITKLIRRIKKKRNDRVYYTLGEISIDMSKPDLVLIDGEEHPIEKIIDLLYISTCEKCAMIEQMLKTVLSLSGAAEHAADSETEVLQ